MDWDDYLLDVGAAAAFGPYMLTRHAFEGTSEIMDMDLEAAADVALYAGAVELGALGMQYSMLKILNAIQGPRYAMSFHQLHVSLNPLRTMAVRTAAPAAVPILAGTVAVKGADLYIESIGQYAPEAPTEKRSFWSSVGAAMAGTFGGMPDVGSY